MRVEGRKGERVRGLIDRQRRLKQDVHKKVKNTTICFSCTRLFTQVDPISTQRPEH